jgi:hypothetical protein
LLGQKWSWVAEVEGGRGGLVEKTKEHWRTSADGLGPKELIGFIIIIF